MVKIDFTKEEIEWLIEGFKIDVEYFKLNEIAKSVIAKLKKVGD